MNKYILTNVKGHAFYEITISEFKKLKLEDLNYSGSIFTYEPCLHSLIKSHLLSLEISHLYQMDDCDKWNNAFIIENCDYDGIESCLIFEYIAIYNFNIIHIVPDEDVEVTE